MGSYREIKGDLLHLFDKGFFDAIGHGANCFCTMGSGIAGQIHKKFPGAYEEDCHTIKGDKSKLGSFTYWPNPKNGSILYNLYTQYNYGRKVGNQYADYKAIREALEGMRDHMHEKLKRTLEIGLPQIGCGLGQGDWKIVKQIIRDVFHKDNVTAVIFDPSPPYQSQKLM